MIDHLDDDLAPARGIAYGTLIGFALWAIIIACVVRALA
jgi:hypothetical protein